MDVIVTLVSLSPRYDNVPLSVTLTCEFFDRKDVIVTLVSLSQRYDNVPLSVTLTCEFFDMKDVIVTLVTAVPRYDNVLLSVTFLIGPGEYRTCHFRMCMAAAVITL